MPIAWWFSNPPKRLRNPFRFASRGLPSPRFASLRVRLVQGGEAEAVSGEALGRGAVAGPLRQWRRGPRVSPHESMQVLGAWGSSK